MHNQPHPSDQATPFEPTVIGVSHPAPIPPPPPAAVTPPLAPVAPGPEAAPQWPTDAIGRAAVAESRQTPTVAPVDVIPPRIPADMGSFSSRSATPIPVRAIALVSVIVLLVGGVASFLFLSGGTDDDSPSAAEQRIEQIQEQIALLEDGASDAQSSTTIQAPTTTAAPTTIAPTTVAPTTAPPTTVTPSTVAPTTTTAPTTVAPTTATPTGLDDISDVEQAVEGLPILEVALALEPEAIVEDVRSAGESACRVFESNPIAFDVLAEAAFGVVVEVEPEAESVYGGLEGWMAYQDRLLNVYCPDAVAAAG